MTTGLAFEVPMEQIVYAVSATRRNVPFMRESEAITIWIELKKGTVNIGVNFSQFQVEVIGQDEKPMLTVQTPRTFGGGGSNNSVEIPMVEFLEAIKAGAVRLRIEQLPAEAN